MEEQVYNSRMGFLFEKKGFLRRFRQLSEVYASWFLSKAFSAGHPTVSRSTQQRILEKKGYIF